MYLQKTIFYTAQKITFTTPIVEKEVFAKSLAQVSKMAKTIFD